MRRFFTVLLGAGMASAAPIAANALVADFTDFGAFEAAAASAPTNETSASIGGVTVTAIGAPNLTQQTPGPGVLSFFGRAIVGNNDGLGVNDDEVSEGNTESIEVTFGAKVILEAMAFLDMFYNADRDAANPDLQIGRERAEVRFFDGMTEVGFQTVDAPVPSAPYGFVSVASAYSGAITRLLFTAPKGVLDKLQFRDDTSNDFAVAALKFSVVPLPAPAMMLIGALGGFGLLRRRRKV